MKVLETIKKLQSENDFADIEIYAYTDSSHKEHGDYITGLNEVYSIEILGDKEVLHYEIMDEESYNETILANCCESADFEGWYGTKDAKVLVLFLSESWDEEKKESEDEDLDKKNMIDQLYSLPGFETELSKKDMANQYTKAEIIDMLDAYDLEFSDAEYDGTILEITPSQHKEITARINKYHAEWDKKNTKQISIKLNNNTDSDIIAWLSTQRSTQGAIKEAIREYMKK